MTTAATLSPTDDELAQQVADAILAEFSHLHIVRVVARLDRDWSGDAAVYFQLIASKAPTSAELDPLRRRIHERTRELGLDRIPYTSLVLESELAELEEDRRR